jgi:glycosyltransferase involved in cell wall biosynthesis
MRRRLVIVTEIISPYRIPLFNALSQHPDVNLHVIFLGETDPNLRQWQVYTQEIRFSFQVLLSWRRRIGRYNALLNLGIAKALRKSAPEVILCGGYSYVASWQALLWAGRHHVPFLLWSESNLQDYRRSYAPTEFLKKQFLQRCGGFVVPGRSALKYVRAHRAKENSIFVAPNAVDNELFARAAENARRNQSALRKELALPNRYFLFVGRLVREKGVFELLRAYANLSQQVRQEIGLVFVGDGDSRAQLEKTAVSISAGTIRFAGFAQRERLGAYYGLADALVLPTYTDTWGMVVNEAMACGLPVILSRAAGCAADLVHENWNGLLVTPNDVSGLESAMKHLAEQSDLLATMGAHSAERICNYSPQTWSDAVARAIQQIGTGSLPTAAITTRGTS